MPHAEGILSAGHAAAAEACNLEALLQVLKLCSFHRVPLGDLAQALCPSMQRLGIVMCAAMYYTRPGSHDRGLLSGRRRRTS